MPDVVALHEPSPVMNGRILKGACLGENALVTRAWHRQKLPQILRDARGHQFYIETNHLFLKSFHDLALAEFADRLAVIHLVRPPVEVAKSLFNLGQIPSSLTQWYLMPEAPTNMVPWNLLAQQGLSHGFYDCLWYWLEIEARARSMKHENPDLLWLDLRTEDLNSPERMRQLATSLGIDWRDDHAFEVVPKLNRKRTHKKQTNDSGLPPLPPSMVETMFVRFQDVYKGTQYGDLLMSEAG
jgi:hypothetical protein